MPKMIQPRKVENLSCDMEAAVTAFKAYCDSKNLSPRTIEYYSGRLLSLSRYINGLPTPVTPAEITPLFIRDYLVYEKDHTSPSTANHALCTVKVFLGFLHDEGYIDSNPAAQVKRQKVRKNVVETFSPGQIEALLGTCKRDFYGVRDRAIMLTLLDTGLRATELCTVTLDDVDWTDQTIRVIGKGDKERIVPFGQGVRQALSKYLTLRGTLASKALFVGHYGDPIDRNRLQHVITRRAKQAGTTGVRCSPHTFRHTAAVSYLRAGGDTFTLQKMLGHTSQEMTRRYCESLSAGDVQAKHRLFSPVDNMKLNETGVGRKRIR